MKFNGNFLHMYGRKKIKATKNLYFLNYFYRNRTVTVHIEIYALILFAIGTILEVDIGKIQRTQIIVHFPNMILGSRMTSFGNMKNKLLVFKILNTAL